jgi:hypothetical protein
MKIENYGVGKIFGEEIIESEENCIVILIFR